MAVFLGSVSLSLQKHVGEKRLVATECLTISVVIVKQTDTLSAQFVCLQVFNAHIFPPNFFTCSLQIRFSTHSCLCPLSFSTLTCNVLLNVGHEDCATGLHCQYVDLCLFKRCITDDM